MTGSRTVVPLPADSVVRRTLAEWSWEAWADLFPDDDVDAYLALYAQAGGAGLPRVWVSFDELGRPTGTASLVEDDDLPDAMEQGPWLAAVWVHPDHRRHGDGTRLVAAATATARTLGHAMLYLYTHDAVGWYERAGWMTLREANLRSRPVTVMALELTTI